MIRLQIQAHTECQRSCDASDDEAGNDDVDDDVRRYSFVQEQRATDVTSSELFFRRRTDCYSCNFSLVEQMFMQRAKQMDQLSLISSRIIQFVCNVSLIRDCCLCRLE